MTGRPKPSAAPTVDASPIEARQASAARDL
jgi:hypothetical protein